MVDRTGDLPRHIEFSPCSQGGMPLPGGVERGSDYRRTIDLTRVGVDPAVVHRALGNALGLLVPPSTWPIPWLAGADQHCISSMLTPSGAAT